MSGSTGRRLLLLVGGATALLYSFRPAAWLPGPPLTEDGFYALAVARQFANGQGFSIGDFPTNGFQPLWVVVSAPIYWLSGADRVTALRGVLGLSTVLWLLTAALLARRVSSLAREVGVDPRLAAGMSLCVWLGSVPLLAEFHNGLETGLNLLVLLLTVEFIDRSAAVEWTRDQILGAATLLGLLFYARQDTVFFIAAFACIALVGRSYARNRRACLIALTVMAIAILPWLLRNLGIDGHLMPTSGRAQALGRNLHNSVSAVAMAFGIWALPAAFPPIGFKAASVVWAVTGAVALTAAVWPIRTSVPALIWRRPGLQALLAHIAALALFYALLFDAPYFAHRYLAPLALITIPMWALGVAAWARRFTYGVPVTRGVALLVAVIGLASHVHGSMTRTGSEFYDDQTSFALSNIRPDCVVGALQTGTLGYFRERVINLDGKVNAEALAALSSGELPRYVARSPIEVLIDWPSLSRRALGANAPFSREATIGRFEVWMRNGRRDCLMSPAPDFR